MFKCISTGFLVATAALLIASGTACARLADLCQSSCELSATGAGMAPYGLFVCPQGDTNNWFDQQGLPGSGNGFVLTLTIFDLGGNPIPNIPAADFWVFDCDPVNDIVLCSGAASTNADSPTNAAGVTTIGRLGGTAAGGCADGMIVIVQGIVLQDPDSGCTTDLCKPILFRSPDISGDLEVTLSDLTTFSFSFPPGAYDPCCDMNVDAIISLSDLSLFAFHFGPPGHICI